MVMSDCGIEMPRSLNDTGRIYVNQGYDISNSPYRIEVQSIFCDAPTIELNFTNITIKKKGIVIGSGTYFVGGGHQLFDNDNLCIALNWFNCSGTPWVAFRAWWKITNIKELVTNLTDNEFLIKAVVGINFEYLGKYPEGNNWVFQFNKIGEYIELGIAAGLAKFVQANFKTIAALLATWGVVSIVWFWRDAVTKKEEVKGEISDDVRDVITKILQDPTLTPEQKVILIEEVLRRATYKEPLSLSTVALAGIIVVGSALLLLSILDRKKTTPRLRGRKT